MSTVEQDPVQQAEPVEAAKPLFRFADVVELPDGQQAFVRLPNQFQHADINLKARAAQARRMRQLRDPDSDAFVVLDGELDDLLRAGDKAPVIEELTGREWWRDHLEAVKDVQEDERFASIDEDLTRLEELTAKAVDQRPADEYAELERHVEAYNTAIEARREEHQRPRREALADRDITDLVADVREQRITAEGRQVFNRTFSIHEIAAGTFHVQTHADGKPHPTDRYFADAQAVEDGDAEVLSVLAAAFAELEAQFNRGAVGNG